MQFMYGAVYVRSIRLSGAEDRDRTQSLLTVIILHNRSMYSKDKGGGGKYGRHSTLVWDLRRGKAGHSNHLITCQLGRFLIIRSNCLF